VPEKGRLTGKGGNLQTLPAVVPYQVCCCRISWQQSAPEDSFYAFIMRDLVNIFVEFFQ